MTKLEIIAKTIAELSCPSDYIEVVTAELRRRLPDQAITTCDDFAVLSERKCCETCHTFYAHYDMDLIKIQEDEWAWVCCSVCDAIRLQVQSNASNTEVRDMSGPHAKALHSARVLPLGVRR
jgi:hypothetical protein